MAAWTDAWWSRTGTISVAVHVLATVALLHTWLFWAKPLPPAGTTRGTQRVLLYLPGKSAAPAEQTVKAAPKPKSSRKHLTLPTYKALTETATAHALVAPHVESVAGNDAMGTGSVNIARVQAFPAVKPDLSTLTIGSSADVVVDVEIDDTGKVASATAKRGMGHGIDEVVIATVEQWVFYPATKNGRPVASEQELHFHYDRGRDSQPCGWDCFQLAGR